MIQEAQKIISDRRRDRETMGKEQKEGIVELLEQKKEMFLVEMTAGIIENERETLIQKSGDKEDALKKSDEMLEKDWKEFETYKHKNKQETDQAVQEYNQEVDFRKRTETDYKIKNNEFTSLKAEKSKNEELLQKYLDAKNFLQKLTPKETLEQRERELKSQIEAFKQQWMDKELMSRDESFLSDTISKAPSNKDKKPAGRKAAKGDLEKVFAEKLEKEDFDEIEEFKWNQKMFFQDPEQLIEIFTRSEEGSVSLIQMMQDTEQNLENLRNNLNMKKAEFDKKISGLRENKMQLEKNKAEKEAQVKALRLKSKEPALEKKYDGLLPFRKKIIEIVNLFKDESKTIVDQEALTTLELLATVEINLERQLERLNQYKAPTVLEQKREHEDNRKRANRKIQLEAEQKLAEERSKKASERALEKSKKRKGRVDMMKSTPVEKKEEVTQVVDTNEEEEDMKYFNPYMTKF